MSKDKIESTSRPLNPIDDTIECIIKSRNKGEYADPSACAAAIMQLGSFSKTDRVKALLPSLKTDPDPTKPLIKPATPPSSPESTPSQMPKRNSPPPIPKARPSDEHHV